MKCLGHLGMLLGACLAFSQPMASRAETPTVSTSRDSFAIPFRYDHTELARLQATKVQLFVSQDQGNSWQLEQQSGIELTEFTFEPAVDGEYWFSVAVVAADGKLHPEPTTQPAGLKVIVDRAVPQLELTLRSLNELQVGLNWKATDAYLAEQTLELEYRNSEQENWKKVYVKPLQTGQTSWKIQAGQIPEVRGRIADQAGNVTETVAMLAAQGPVIQSAARVDARASEPIAQTAAIKPALPVIQPGETWEQQPVEKESVAALRPLEPKPTAAKNISNQAPAMMLQNDSTGHQAFTNTSHAVRYINARDFQIEYQVTGVGPSGVGLVELFVTENGGGQWWRYGVDADQASPMSIKVPADGNYGFHFRIHSGVGNAEIPPQPGQTPQIQVVVDSTPPNVRLLKAHQGYGEHTGQMTVQWEFQDDHPSEKPITLLHAANPTGPWHQAFPAVPNTGSHTFQLPGNLSSRVYLKLVGTDAAGNTAEFVAPEPVLIDLSRPSARVIMIDTIR